VLNPGRRQFNPRISVAAAWDRIAPPPQPRPYMGTQVQRQRRSIGKILFPTVQAAYRQFVRV
jgi:hypothetical protein